MFSNYIDFVNYAATEISANIENHTTKKFTRYLHKKNAEIVIKSIIIYICIHTIAQNHYYLIA